MELNYKKLGARLKEERIKKKLTQEQVAEKINLTSVYISHIERGSGKTSLETLVKICNVLDITPDYVLLDSLYHSTEYFKSDLAQLLNKCSNKEIAMITKLIKTFIEERDS